MKISYTITYDITTNESAEHGDTSDNGFIINGWEYSIQDTPYSQWQKEDKALIVQTADGLREFLDVLDEYGCRDRNYGSGSFYSVDPVILDYGTDEERQYAIHLSGKSERHADRIQSIVQP